MTMSRPRSHRWSLLISLALLVALSLGAIPAYPSATTSAADLPTLTLKPDHGQPGDELVLRGTGFPADASGEVRLTLDDSVQATVSTDTIGSFEGALPVPALAPGSYELEVVVGTPADDGAVPDAPAEVAASVTVTVDAPPTPLEAPPTDVPPTATATDVPPTGTPTEIPPTEAPTAFPTAAATATGTETATPKPTATATAEDQGVGSADTTPATLTLSKDKSKYNGEVTATVTGLAPNGSVTLRWPRPFEITSGPDAGQMTTLLDSATTDGAGRAPFAFKTPLEPTGGKASATLRVIPRILLNEDSGPKTTRLRVYFYGFGPGERIETRWHATGSSASGSVVLKTLTVAANGRASSIVTIPNATIGAHLIVGKVLGVSRSASTPFTLTRSTETVTALAVGDATSCDSTGDEAVAAVIAQQPGTLLIAGDIAYNSGTAQEFADCYDPAWGPFKSRTRPASGNHEYVTPGASGYFDYFGAAAGDPAKGYYSFDLGAWHVVSLNSNCASVAGGCAAGSAQEQWLRADLAANPSDCTLAYFHHPLFSSGEHGSDPRMLAIWQALYDAAADLILSGHDHNYERFAPQTPQGAADPTRGIREFVVGTGGKSHYAIDDIKPNSQVTNGDTFGVLKLALAPTGYSWTFLPVAGGAFADSGAATCHDADGPIAGGAGASVARTSLSGVARSGETPGWPLPEVTAAVMPLDDRWGWLLG